MVSLRGSALAAACDYNGTDHGYPNFKLVNQWCEDFVMDHGDPIVCEKDRMIGHKMFPEGSVVLQLPVAIARNHSSWIAHCLESNGLPYSFSHMGGLGDLGDVVFKRQQGKKLIGQDVTHFLFRRVKIHDPKLEGDLLVSGELRLSDVLDAFEGQGFRPELQPSKKRKAEQEDPEESVAAPPAKQQKAKPQAPKPKPQAASPAKPKLQVLKSPAASPAKPKPQVLKSPAKPHKPPAAPPQPKAKPVVKPEPESEPESEASEYPPAIKVEPADVKVEDEDSEEDWLCDKSNFDVIVL